MPISSDAQPFLHFRLRELNWQLNKLNFSLVTTFLSPHLMKIDIKMDSLRRRCRSANRSSGKVPPEMVAVVCSAIKMFPSSLRFLRIYLGTGPEAGLIEEISLTQEVSTFILRRGESLREFHSNLALSPEAVAHLVNLPNLRNWIAEQKPPRATALIHDGITGGPTSLLPSLKSLQLRGEAALEWLSVFNSTKNRYHPRTMVGNNLSRLLHTHSTCNADSTLLSKLLPLTNLVEITVGLRCLPRGAGCALRFSDQDMECLAVALPNWRSSGWAKFHVVPKHAPQRSSLSSFSPSIART